MRVAPLLIALAALPMADPTKPAMVTLDFKERPLPEIVAAIAERSGNSVTYQFFNENDGNVRKVTVTSAELVPFWEAIDRVCAVTKLQRTLNEGGGPGNRLASVSLYGPGVEPGPAHYSGPFRFGKFTLHATYRKRFVNPTIPLDPAVADGYRAEFEALPEPRVLAIRTGPLKGLEAIDDQGKSLLDPAAVDPEKVSAPVSASGFGAFQSTVRVRLGKPAEGSKRLVRLKGVMPVELAIPAKSPTATIVLADQVGKTTRAGDIAITVEEFTHPAGAAATLKLLVKIEGRRAADAATNKALAWARTAAIQKCLEVVDADGRVLAAANSGTSAGDELRANFTFWPNRGFGQAGGTPKSLRVYAPEWVQWDAPFEFNDIFLP